MHNKSFRTAVPFGRKAMPYLLLSLATIAPMSVQAWGFKGHTYIGDVAWEYLSPEAKAWVTDKLERVDETSLGEMVTWADRIRRTTEGRNMGPLHYANVPPTEVSFNLQRDCEAMRCVVGAAIQSSEVMLDKNSSPREQAVALRAFTHWITDLHQPLHLGFYEDRGGNSIRVTYQGHETNLHALWDTVLLTDELLINPADLVAANPLPKAPDNFNQAILDWATTSNQLAREYAYAGAEHEGEISQAYVQRAEPIIQQQLLHSAQRLAMFIEASAR